MNEWKEVKVEHVILSANTGLDAIKRAPIVEKNTGIKCLRIQDISQNKNYDDWGFTEVEKRNFEKFQLQKNDIIVARTGATIGVNLLIKNRLNAVFNNGLIRIRVNEGICDPQFLFYNFRSNNYNGFIESISGGTSTQPNMQINALLCYEILLPPLLEQKVIVSILRSLDDKIELLHSQNTTLEKMAETLFRQLFVEEAKDGWDNGFLDDILSVKGGTTPSTTIKEYWDGNVCWTSPKDITNLDGIFLFDTERKITELGLQKISSGLLPKGTLLMSSRAPVGVLAFAEIPLAINQGYIAILDDKGFSKEFIYLWLKANMETVQSYANGSTFLEISKTAFKSLQISKPPKQLLDSFQPRVKPLFEKIKANQIQIRTLTALRDSLLPKLMSGEVRVQIS